MPLLRVDRLALVYGATEVLGDLTFQVEPRQRLGIVGANGSGKSSLLKAITGELISTAGSLTLAPRARTAYLAQELEAGPHESVYADALHSRPDIIGLRQRLEGLEAAMAGASGPEQASLVDDYGEVQHEYERLDGYAFDNRVAEVLHGVGLTESDQALAPSALSGGQRRRLALARLLLQDADLLLLDEPTNHLDLEAIEWLEDFLRLSRAGMLIVSHDRRFLERTTDDILELQAGTGEWYPGNYRQYLRLRRERRALRQKEYDAQQDYIARTEEFIRRYKAGQRAREARGRQTKLDRLDRVAPPSDDQQIRVGLRASGTSDLIFQSDRLTLSYPAPAGAGGPGWGLQVPAFTINAGERVAIVGPNGSGKTSLLKALLGELRPLKGRVKSGPRVTMRYYDQHLADLDPNKTVLTELQDAFGLPEETLRTFLGRLLFRGDDAFKVIRSLSGGEKSRVALAKLMLDDAGLLLLDEPTNQLDIPAQEMLEEALQDFEGTIVFVSHDRYFIDAIATRLWVIDDGAVTLHLGNYSDLERRRQREPRPGGEAARPRRADQVRPVDRQAEGASTTGVEDRIDELEGEVRRIEEQLADHQTYDDPARVAELARAHEDASGRLRALYQEWEQAAGE